MLTPSRRTLLGLGGAASLGLVVGCTPDAPPERLADWQLRLTAGTATTPRSIGFLGDSITFGAGAPGSGNSTPKFRWCYPGQLRDLLTPTYGDAGTGWVLMNHGLWPTTADNVGWDPRIAVNGRIGKPRAGLFGHACFRIPPGGENPSSYVEFTAAGSTFSTLVLAQPAGRQLISVDGSAPVRAHGARTGPHLVADIPTGSDGPHTIRVSAAGDSIDLVAVRASTGAGRLSISTVAISGESLGTFLGGDPAKSSAYAGLPFLNTFGFDLLVVALGTNDYNTGTPLDAVRRSLSAIVDRQRATGGDVALSFPPISAPRLYRGPPAPTYTDYEQLYAAVATDLGVPFLDLTHLWGPDFATADAVQPQKYADHAIHPSDLGAHDIAEEFRAFFAL